MLLLFHAEYLLLSYLHYNTVITFISLETVNVKTIIALPACYVTNVLPPATVVFQTNIANERPSNHSAFVVPPTSTPHSLYLSSN